MLENNYDIVQIEKILEKSLDDEWIREFIYLLRRFFFIEYWLEGKENEQQIVQRIKYLLKEYLTILSEGNMETEDILRKFEQELPSLRELVVSDINAAYECDPVAESYIEIIVSYPGPSAVLVQRVANCLYKLKVPIIPRIMTEYAHSKTAIDIHPGAMIGKSFFIDHGTGVVIGETTIIGNNVKIYQGVTLGALSTRGGRKQKYTKRHPTVEDNVTIYAGATILGGTTIIGKGAVIGGNAWITQSVSSLTKYL